MNGPGNAAFDRDVSGGRFASILRAPGLRLVVRAVSVIREEGGHAFFGRVAKKCRHLLYTLLGPRRYRNALYRAWIRKHEPRHAELERQRRTRFALEPLISLVVPDCGTEQRHLGAVIESVARQTYPNWELCLAVGEYADPHITAALLLAAGTDTRVRVCRADDRVASAAGEFITFVGGDDTLAPQALFQVVRAINLHPEADLLYSDEDKIDESGRHRFDPHFKPAWSPDLLRSQNYVNHLAIYRKGLAQAAGGRRTSFDGAEDHDLVLRASERARAIVHIPHVLYHARACPQPTGDADSSARAVQEHLDRQGLNALARPNDMPGGVQVRYALCRRPLVSIVIPNKDQKGLLQGCLASLARSSYQDYEVLIVENNSQSSEIFDFYAEAQADPRVRLLNWRHRFNYSAINNWAAAQARGEYLLLLNNDTEAQNADWIERLLEYGQREDVGAVGAKLCFPDQTLQHAGVVVGICGVAGHSYQNEPGDSPGWSGELAGARNQSAVTGACLLMRKAVFDEVGGFDEKLAVTFNDVDLCLKVRETGRLVVWTPEARLTHHESKTRGPEDSAAKRARARAEAEYFRQRWRTILAEGDPYYNPNLTLDLTLPPMAPEPHSRRVTARVTRLQGRTSLGEAA
jgi:GT2 family glycosyltransferase